MTSSADLTLQMNPLSHCLVSSHPVFRDADDNAVEWLQMRPRAWHHLDELFAGACDGMTYEEIEEQYPEEFQLRENDKLAYRYPRGESYLDVIARLEPIIMEMERHREPLLIVGHQGIAIQLLSSSSAYHLQHSALASIATPHFTASRIVDRHPAHHLRLLHGSVQS
jgi:broad specificity phosphatase PhoE